MLVAYGAHLAQAVSRGRTESDDGEWSNREIGPAIAGLAVLVAGAYVTVVSTERIVADPGISNLLGGLFITAPIGVAPEVFGT